MVPNANAADGNRAADGMGGANSADDVQEDASPVAFPVRFRGQAPRLADARLAVSAPPGGGRPAVVFRSRAGDPQLAVCFPADAHRAGARLVAGLPVGGSPRPEATDVSTTVDARPAGGQ